MLAQTRNKPDSDETFRLRQEAGQWLRGLREAAGLSQRELARAVEIDYYTFISQIESGRGRVPPAQIAAWAVALNVPARDFAIEMMRFYDPVNYELIFAGAAEETPATVLEQRITRLEKLLQKK